MHLKLPLHNTYTAYIRTHRYINLSPRGKYGIVYKCESVETKAPLALKIMLKKGNKKEDVMREVDILKKIKHPGVLTITDFIEGDREYVLVTEL